MLTTRQSGATYCCIGNAIEDQMGPSAEGQVHWTQNNLGRDISTQYSFTAYQKVPNKDETKPKLLLR